MQVSIRRRTSLRHTFYRLPNAFLRLSIEEATFKKRGFQESSLPSQRQLEISGMNFINGYNIALTIPDVDELYTTLNATPKIFRGFAFEGAAMAYALLHLLYPFGRGRLFQLMQRAPEHIYMIHVGAGWAFARLHRPNSRLIGQLDPLLRWLTVDGYGFHEGYFYPYRSFRKQQLPRSFGSSACRVFDQGLGRSLWFVEGASVTQVAEAIASFPEARQADLWSGVGLASCYAGGAKSEALHSLVELSGEYCSHLGQGAAFAAKARQRAGTETPYTEMACTVLCGLGIPEAAAITDHALSHIEDIGILRYEAWRAQTRRLLAQGNSANRNYERASRLQRNPLAPA